MCLCIHVCTYAHMHGCMHYSAPVSCVNLPYCIALHCTTLWCVVLWFVVLLCIVLYRSVMYCAVLYCIALRSAALHNTLLCPIVQDCVGL